MRITDAKSNYNGLAYIKALNTFQDLISEGFNKKTNVVSKINSYLKKYKVEDLNTLTEIFECEFKEMKKANLNIINNNKEVLASGGGKNELNDANDFVSYVLTNKDGVPIKCDIKYVDDNLLIFIKGTINSYIYSNKKYIAVRMEPTKFNLIINIDEKHSLNIDSDYNEIKITEVEGNKLTCEEYYIITQNGQDAYRHQKNSKENIIEIE